MSAQRRISVSYTHLAAWEDHGQGADMGVLVSSHETLRQAGIRDVYKRQEAVRLQLEHRDLRPEIQNKKFHL